jgi:hypothetical protein
MNVIDYSEDVIVDTYSSVFNRLSFPTKLDLMELLIKSLKNEQRAFSTSEFIPEKSAEQIVSELRESRSFGKTRVIEPF